MKLKTTSNATRRTVNRIREHGPVFEDITRENTGRNLRRDDELGDCVLVRSSGHLPWIGWLPIDEIERTSLGGVKFIWPLDENLELSSGGWGCLNLQKWLKECE